MPTSILQKK